MPDRWFHLLREDAQEAFAALLADDEWIGRLCSDVLAMMNKVWTDKRAAEAVITLSFHRALIQPMINYAQQPDPSDDGWCQDLEAAARQPQPQHVGGLSQTQPGRQAGWQCHLCGKICKTEGGLKRHITLKHAQKEEEAAEEVETVPEPAAEEEKVELGPNEKA
jgi:hypothetical protein